MSVPPKTTKAGRKPGPETPAIKRDREAIKRKKDVEGFIEAKSNGGKKSSGDAKTNYSRLTPEKKAAANEKRKKPQLSPAQFAEMKALWESGEVTLDYLAERFDRDPTSISRLMNLNGVIKGSKAEEYSRLIQEKIVAELSGDPSENAKRIRQAKEDHLKYQSVIEKLTWSEMVQAQQKGLAMQAILPNVKALREVAAVFAATRAEKWALMGVIEFEQRMESEDVPELLISELTNQDIEQMRMDQHNLATITGGLSSIDEDIVDESLSESDIVEEGDE